MNKKKEQVKKSLDWAGVILFFTLTFVFVLLMIFNKNYFNWAWSRHHNPLSWYIRTVALVPYMYFSYKKSITGMMFSVFMLATSMAWFPSPEQPTKEAIAFLELEYEYLTSGWTAYKILMALTIPVMFVLLGMAFWKRNFLYGGYVVVGANGIKIIWSFIEGRQSAWTIIPVAAFGTILTIVLIYFGAKREKKRQLSK